MKLYILALIAAVGIMDLASAAPASFVEKTTVSAKQKTLFVPGYCQVEIINSSGLNVKVFGTRDDGAPLLTFNIFSNERFKYINLIDSNGLCHGSTYLDIVTLSNYRVYGNYTNVGASITI